MVTIRTSNYAWSRRHFIAAGAGVAFSGAPALANTARRRTRTLSLYCLHTGERIRRTYRIDGSYCPSALTDINTLLRDFRADETRNIDISLLDFLSDLHAVMNSDQPFHVISGYRSPKTNAMLAQKSGGVAKRSFHMKGMAIDVRLPGHHLAALREAAINLRLGGVGYYRKSDFLHLDTGRIRFW